MHRNLRAEMSRNGITTQDIARAIGKTERSARDKVKGIFPFTMQEAMQIRDQFFAEMPLDYLFAQVG